MLNIYIAVARFLAPIIAQDPRVRVVIVEEIARLILTDDTPVVLTDDEKAAILQIKADLEATG